MMITENLPFALLILLWRLASISTESLFTSNEDLFTLLKTEKHFLLTLSKYVTVEQERLDKLKGLINSMQHPLHTDETELMKNPVNAFKIIRQMVENVAYVNNVIVNETVSNVNSYVESVSSRDQGMVWASSEDLEGAATGLIRLKHTYQLGSKLLSDGSFDGIETDAVLDTDDCFRLGKTFFNKEMLSEAIVWFALSLEKRRTTEPPNIFLSSEIDALEHLAYSLYLVDDVKRARYWTQEILRLEPDHERATQNLLQYDDLLAETNTTIVDQFQKQKLRGDPGNVPTKFINSQPNTTDIVLSEIIHTYDVIDVENESQEYYRKHFADLCRFSAIEDYYRSSSNSLHCVLKWPEELSSPQRRKHFRFRSLAPFKVEYFNRSPDIMVFHDIISEMEIEELKKIAKPNFKRGVIINPLTGLTEFADYRISKSAWFTEHDTFVVGRLYNRVALITGLDMSVAESLQVGNYGIGGHYDPHYDHSRNSDEKSFHDLGPTGNRIATCMFYLSNVELGGATAFNLLDIAVRPKAGSAVFWYNLRAEDGSSDDLTYHGGCPVLYGSKWVANAWIHQLGQEIVRPCYKSLVDDR